MEVIIKNGRARTVLNRYKAVLDSQTGNVIAVPLKVIYRIIGGVAVEVWALIRSCFGNGYWRDDQPWNDNDGWNNGT